MAMFNIKRVDNKKWWKTNIWFQGPFHDDYFLSTKNMKVENGEIKIIITCPLDY